MPAPSAPRLLLLFAAVLSCNADIEGNTPGECEDGADNDSDGYFDCGDNDCFGAPYCTGAGDDDDDNDVTDDDTADDDTADDDTSDDDTADDDTTDDDTADDDTTPDGDGVTPVITEVTYTYAAASSAFTFSVEAHDPDANFGVPLLLWSVDGVPQTPTSIGQIPLQGDAYFDIQLNGAVPGTTYGVLFAIRDADSHVSEGYLVNATAQ